MKRHFSARARVRGSGRAIALVVLSCALGCVPYRVKHHDYSQIQIPFVDGRDVRVSLVSSAGPLGSRHFGPPYALILLVQSASPLEARSHVESLTLRGVSDSTSQSVSFGGLDPLEGRTGVWAANKSVGSIPYQDYVVEGTLVLEIGGRISAHTFRGVLKRANGTSWEFWPWSMFMSA